MLVADAALATGQIVQSQAPADRHPAYDAAEPDIPGIYPEATELKITASPDNRIFLGSARPFHEEITPGVVELKAWRGERSSCQLVVSTGYAQANLRVTSSPLRLGKHEIATSASMIRYTRAGQRITADVIGHENECQHAAGAHRAIWFEANVPQDAEPGVYRGTVTVTAPGCEPAVQEKSWAEKTCIAIDERPDRMVREAMRLVKENAPSFRIASAVDKPSELTREVYNISPVITHAGTALGDLLRERKAAGKVTTFYVCMHPLVPNTYTTSAPAEAEWLGFFAAANHLDGFLRWAYNSWNRNPLQSTDFGNWTTGDCFLVYPGNRSSIRFERLRDGIEEYEKIRILRERAKESPAAAAIVDSMDPRLTSIFTVERSSQYYIHAQDVKNARAIVDEPLTALNALQEAQAEPMP